MLIKLYRGSGVPVYRQIVDQVKQLVAGGQLAPGAAVDSIRDLARQLHVNRMTVAKAYTRLAGQLVLRTAPGRGMVVADSGGVLTPPVRRQRLNSLLAQVAAEAFQLDVPANEVLALLDQQLKETAALRATLSKVEPPGGPAAGRRTRRSSPVSPSDARNRTSRQALADRPPRTPQTPSGNPERSQPAGERSGPAQGAADDVSLL